MPNSSNITGNNNIVIQGASGDITLDIKDDFIALLTELKAQLKKSNAQRFQIADKIYNIENIHEANFGVLTGKTPFNETLTKRLVDALKIHHDVVNDLAKGMTDGISQSEIGRLQEYLVKLFVGVIEVQLSILIAIGIEKYTESKQRKYIEQCIYIAKRSFDLLNYSLLSELWEILSHTQVSIDPEQKSILKKRFSKSLEYSIPEQFELLKTLHEIFTKNKLNFPITEMGPTKENKTDFAAQMKDDGDLHKVCLSIHELGVKGKATYDVLDCYEAEAQLAALLGHFYFLINYRMVSIKRIDYRQIRNLEPSYLHNYASLGREKDNVKINYSSSTMHTHAVLLYQGSNYQNSINLFPFAIDYNTLAIEDGIQTYFFKALEIGGKGLSFLCLEDGKTIDIERKGVGKYAAENMNEFLIDKDNRKSFNLDCVIDQFHAARDCILGVK